jgi:hypothetical protein
MYAKLTPLRVSLLGSYLLSRLKVSFEAPSLSASGTERTSQI